MKEKPFSLGRRNTTKKKKEPQPLRCEKAKKYIYERRIELERSHQINPLSFSEAEYCGKKK